MKGYQSPANWGGVAHNTIQSQNGAISNPGMPYNNIQSQTVPKTLQYHAKILDSKPVSQMIPSNSQARPVSQCGNDLGSQMDYLFARPQSNDQSNVSTDSSTKDAAESPREEFSQPSNNAIQGEQTIYSSSQNPPHIVKMDEEKSVKPSSQMHPNYSSSGSPMKEEPHHNHEHGAASNQLHPVALGFPNLGNTCYMNSVLQCLLNNPKLSNYFLSGNHLLTRAETPLTEVFGEVISNAYAKKNGVEEISRPLEKFKSTLERVAPVFEGYAQNDAHEFFRLLIEKIHDEINSGPKKSEAYSEFKSSRSATTLAQKAEEWSRYSNDRDRSLVTSTFGGVLVNEVICTKCKHVSPTFEDALDLSLNLPSTTGAASSYKHEIATLEACIREFITNEFIQGYSCESCKKKNTSLKRTTIWKQPETLVIQFKRFIYDQYGDRKKVRDSVSFPLDSLSLDAFMHERSPDHGGKYKLYGVVNHLGNLDSGHYLALVYNEHLKCWLQYNDSKISKVSDKDMLEFSRKSSEPYILFYKRV